MTVHISHAGEHGYTVSIHDDDRLRGAWELSELELRDLSRLLVEKFPPHPALSFASLTNTVEVEARDLRVGQRFFRLHQPDVWLDALYIVNVLECAVEVRTSVDGDKVEMSSDELVRVQLDALR
jgi:hypothetical protein